jgi:PAS domain-containing protein
MNRVHVLGPPNPALRAALARAGIETDPDAPMRLVPYPSMAASIEGDGLTVALVDSPAAQDAALQAGAIDALLLPDDLPVLRTRLGPLVRANAAWRMRLRTQARKARRAMAELQSTRDLLGRLIDATPNPVMATDMRGRVLVFNRAAEAALSYESKWARENMHATDIYVNPGDARRILAEIRGSPSGIIANIETRLRARTGEQIPVMLSAAEVYAADGMPMATVGVFQDQRLELALRNRLEETTEQLIASEKRAAAIEVAGAAAHELNQPLTAVMGSLEMLEMRPDLHDDVHRRIGKAYEQLERMADIVRRMAETTHRRTKGYVGETRILDLTSSPSNQGLE